jgi:hypothetical protein
LKLTVHGWVLTWVESTQRWWVINTTVVDHPIALWYNSNPHRVSHTFHLISFSVPPPHLQVLVNQTQNH